MILALLLVAVVLVIGVVVTDAFDWWDSFSLAEEWDLFKWIVTGGWRK